MPLSSGLSIHDDTKHKGSAKRDMADGVAALDVSGNLLVPGRSVFLTANGSGGMFIVERATGEFPVRLQRLSGNNYELSVKVASNWVLFLHDGMKDIANGIAGLDASALLPEALIPGILEYYSISDDILHEHPNSGNSTSATYIKKLDMASITLYPTPSTIRVYFEMKSSTNGVNVYGRIYKNGAAVGISQTTNGIVYVPFSEDISFADGDNIELWIHSDGSYICSVQEFRVLGIVSHTLAHAIENSDVGVVDAWASSDHVF